MWDEGAPPIDEIKARRDAQDSVQCGEARDTQASWREGFFL